MAVNLPGIRAQAELDLSQIRAQQAQLTSLLGEIGSAFQRLPAARPALDTAGVVQQAQAAATQQAAVQAQGLTRQEAQQAASLARQIAAEERAAAARAAALERADARIAAAHAQAVARQNAVDIAASQKALTDFDAALAQRQPTITPKVDLTALQADLAAVQQLASKAFASFGGISNIPGLGAAGGALAIGGGLATGAGLGLLAKQSLDVAESHEEAMRRIIRATGATGPALEDLKGSLERLAATGRSNVGVLGDVLSQLNVRLGLTGGAAEQLTLQIVKFSAVTGGDAGENVRTLARIFEAWGLSTQEQAGLLDKLTVAFQKTGETPGPLIEELSRFRPVLQQLGLGLSDAIVLFSQLEQNGVPAREVVIGLRQALEQFTKEGREPAAALKETIAELQSLDEAAARAKAFETFGARSGAALLDLARSGKLSSSDLVTALAESDGALDKTGAASQTAAARFERAMRQMQQALLPLGAGILEASGALTDKLVPAVQLAIDKVREFNKAQAEGPISQVFNEAAAEKKRQIEELEAGLREIENIRIKGTLAPPQPGSGGDQVATAGEREREESAALEAQFTKTGDAGQAAAQAVSRDWAIVSKQLADSKNGALDLNAALKAAGSDTSAISGILAWDAALKTIDTSIGTLTDRDLAAYIVALRNQAANTTDAAEKQAILNQAYVQASTGLEAQAAAQAAQKQQADAAKQATDAAAEAAKRQAEEERKLGEAIRDAPLEAMKARLNDLATTATPALTEAQQGLVKQLQAGGDASGAASVALAALGVSAEQARAAADGTGAQFAAFVDHLKRLADTADPVAAGQKAIEESAKSMLATLSAGLPAADRAWLQYTAAREGDRSTLRALYERMGGDLEAFDQATEAQQQRLIARLAQARQAAEVFHSTGRLLPAPEEPDLLGRQAQEQAADRARARARQDEDLARAASRRAADATLAASRLSTDRRTEDSTTATAGRAAEADFQQRAVEIRRTLDAALAQVDHSRGTLFADFARTIAREQEDFQRQWERQQRDFAQQDAESIRGFREQAGDQLVGATSQFHEAAASAVQGLLGLSGSALSQGAAGVVDQFQGLGDAAQQAASQIADAQQTMLDKVRDTFTQINRQASDTIKGIRDQLTQSGGLGNPNSLFGGIFTNLPGQGSAEQQAALKATADRNQALLDANLKQADLATKQQSILDTAAKARADIDKAGLDAEKELAKQQLDLAKQAKDQRAQMISQLTRMVEAFQRQAFQTEQQRADQRTDQGNQLNRQAEDQARALGQQITALNRQLADAIGQASQQAEALRRDQERQALAQQEQAQRQAEQRRRQDADLAREQARAAEDIALARARLAQDRQIEDQRHADEIARAREQVLQGETLNRIEGLLRRRPEGVQQNFNLPNMVLVEPATQFLDIGEEQLRERINARLVS